MKILKHQLQKEDDLRKSAILNVILSGSLVLAFTASIVNLFAHPTPQYPILEILPGIVVVFLYVLYIVSKHISSRLAALILVGVSSLLAYYLAYQWGTVVPQSWILLALTIVMGGILISSRFSLFLIFVHTTTLLVLTDLQIKGKILYQPWDISPMFGSISVAIVTLAVIGLIAWLSNREIEKSLHRARSSEKALKKERNLLEIKVIERTKELEKAQLEKTRHLYRLADFGRMAAGLFHDFVNPLTLVSLNLEQLQARNKGTKVRNLADANSFLERAVDGTRSMENFAQAIRRQLQKQKTEVVFCLDGEISRAINVFAYKAKERKVGIRFINKERVRTYGNPFRFNQLVSNLVSNSIDAYDKVRRRKNREIIIKLARQDSKVLLTVQDFGCGIQKKNLGKIFNPFFTTKSAEKGVGIGLSICKDIVEKELGGKIEVESKEDEWTTATVDFPIRQHGH